MPSKLVRANRRKVSFANFLLDLEARQLMIVGTTALMIAVEMALDTTIITVFIMLFLGILFFLKQSKRLNTGRLRVHPWQILTPLGATAGLLALVIDPVVAQTSSGGVFNQLETKTNTILNQAGAGGVAQQVTGIFGILSILTVIAAISALVFGVFQQQRGGSFQESFMPLGGVILFYLGAQVIMRLFLGA